MSGEHPMTASGFIQAQVDKTIQRNGRRDCCSDPDPRVFLTNPPHAKCLNCGRSVERTTP